MENVTRHRDNENGTSPEGILHGSMAYYVVVGCICVVGTTGNILFLFTFTKDKRLRTVSNILIGHLAFVDLLNCCVLIPWNTVITSGSASILSCSLNAKMFALLPQMSLQCQCLIGCNRYHLVTKPPTVYHKWFSEKNCLLYIIIGWTLSISVVVLIAVTGNPTVDDTSLHYCDSSLDITGTRNTTYYVLCFFSLFYFGISLSFYWKLFYYVRRNAMQLNATKRADSRVSVSLLFLLIVSAVSLLISPLLLYINSLHKDDTNLNNVDAVDQIVTCVLLSNYWLNPIIYGFKIRYVNETLTQIFCCRRQDVVHPTTGTGSRLRTLPSNTAVSDQSRNWSQ